MHKMDNLSERRDMTLTYSIDAPLLRTLMRRDGTGARVSVRALADHCGLAVGTIGGLRKGTQRTLNEDAAKLIAERIGVDLLVLFTPQERAGSSRPAKPRRKSGV